MDLFDDDLSFETADFDIDDAPVRRSRPPEKRLSSPISAELGNRVFSTVCHSTHTEVSEGVLYSKGMTLSQAFELSADRIRGHRQDDYGAFHRTLRHIASCFATKGITSCEILTAKMYPKLFKLNTPRTNARCQQDAETADFVYSAVIDSWCRSCADILKPGELKRFRDSLRTKSLDNESIIYGNREYFWSSVVETYRANFRNRSPAWTRHSDIIHTAYGDGYLLLHYGIQTKTHCYLMTYEQLQMIQDCTLARHNVYAALSLGVVSSTTSDIKEKVTQMIEWQESCLSAYGNSGYEIVKAPEAVYKARLNTLSNGDILPVSSYSRTISKIRDKELAIAGDGSLTSRLEEIALSVTSLSVAVELYGLAKLSGHPSVYAEKSAASVRNEALGPGTIVPLSVLRMTRSIKHIILSGYLSKHAAWPPLRSLPLPGTDLRRHYNNQVTELPFSSYDHSALDTLEFDKFLQFDYSDDYLKFLDDKAICPGAQHTHEFWFGLKTGTRRLLLKAAQEKDFCMSDIVERLRHGKFESDEMIVELTQKERELKIAARCFCKLPIAVRCFFTLTEYNIAEYLFKDYIPQQTMTMSASATKSRLYKLARRVVGKEQNSALLEIDFSRWNLRWRNETVQPVARILEHIFGLQGVFSQAHPFFSKATVVLTDKNRLPDGVTPGSHAGTWPESSLVWRNHMGGFEGIQQKLWTLCTIGMMYQAVRDSQASFLMAGQGDNQIFAITFDLQNGTLSSQLLRLLARIEFRCSTLNHEVKPEECIDSASVVTYSKEVYINGTHYQYGLKFASRSMSVSDSDLPSLFAEISTVSASAVALADCITSPLLGYFWQCYRMLRLMTERLNSIIYRDERFGIAQLFRQGDEAAMFALVLPGSLGGLPLQSFGRFFMKGEVDDLTWDVSACLRIKEQFPPLARDMDLLLSGAYSSRQPALRNLILDPHSIPLARPKDAKSAVRAYVSERFPDYVKNRHIHQIVKTDVAKAGDSLMDALASARPLHPEIMADILKCSLYGLRDSILGRFTMTRTINDLLRDKSFVAAINTANRNLLRYVGLRWTRCSTHRTATPYKSGDAFEVCSRLRQFWGQDVDNTSIGTYCPLDMTLSNDITSNSAVSAHSMTPANSFLTSPGPYPPNFGTRTRQKRSEHGYKIIMSSDTVLDLKLLMLTLSELGADTNIKSVCEGIILSRSPFTVDSLSGVMPSVFGGTAAHRHDRMQSQPFSTLGSNTVPTHLTFCSDTCATLCGGDQDYPVVFQELYLFLTALAQLISASRCHSRPFAVSLTIPTMRPIEPKPVTITNTPTISWPDVRGNPLAYITEIQFAQLRADPPSNIVPQTIPSRRSVLISLLLDRHSVYKRSISGMSVSGPHEEFDLKELTGFSAHEILDCAAVCASINAVFRLCTTHKNLGTLTGQQELLRLLHDESQMLARILCRPLLHPTFSNDTLVREWAMNIGPGYFGADTVLGPVTGYILCLARLNVHARRLQSSEYRVALFEDSHLRMASIAYKIAVFWLATSDFDNRRLFISKQEKAVLAYNYFLACRCNDPVLGLVRMIQSIDHFYQESPLLERRRRYHPETWHPFCYLRSTSAEAARTLRQTRRLAPMLAPQIPLGCLATTPATGAYRYRVHPSDGTTALCGQEHRVPYRTTSLSYLLRPLGRFASVYSDWLAYFRTTNVLRSYNTIISVGVGLGAVARSVLELTTADVWGLEIPQYFPLISQRDVVFVPSEVKQINNERFKWHPRSFSHPFVPGSVVFPEDFTQAGVAAVFVFDIDSDDLCVLDSVSSSTIDFVARVRLCEMNLKQFLSVCPCKVSCLSPHWTDHTQTWMLSGRSKGVPFRSGNHNCVESSSRRPWRPRFSSSADSALQRFNDVIAVFGLEERVFSFTRAAEIRRQCEHLRGSSKAIDRSLQTLDAYPLALELLTTADLEPILRHDDRLQRRAALIHAAAVRPDLCRTLI